MSWILRLRMFLSAIFLTILFANIACGATADSRAFLEEAKKAWKELKAKYQSGTKVTFNYSIAGKPELKRELYIKNDKEWNKYDYGEPEQYIEAKNSSYSFKLQKPSADSNWTIVKLNTLSKINTDTTQSLHGLLELTACLFEPVMLEDQWLDSVFSSEKVDIVSATSAGDGEIITIRFKCQDYKVDKYVKLLDGEISFRKNLYYVIDSYKVRTEFVIEDAPALKERGKSGVIRSEVVKSFEYDIIDSIPFPRIINAKYNVTPRDGKGVFKFPENNVSVVRYEIKQRGTDIDDSIFNLSHYGFSEPVNTLRRANWIRTILAISGLVLVLVGLYFRRKTTKRNITDQLPQQEHMN